MDLASCTISNEKAIAIHVNSNGFGNDTGLDHHSCNGVRHTDKLRKIFRALFGRRQWLVNPACSRIKDVNRSLTWIDIVEEAS